MSEEADAVVVGGGTTGLGLAHCLVQRGIGRVIVLERGYLGTGASGRFPGGVFQQYPTANEVSVAKRGVKILEGLSAEMGFNVMFKQKGSLILAHTEKETDDLRSRMSAQGDLGTGARLVDQEGAKGIVPMIEDGALLAASYCPKDGVIYPYALLWGYAKAINEKGGEVRTQAPVESIEIQGAKVESVVANGRRIRTSLLVNAAGTSSGELSRLVGLDAARVIRRTDFIVTEPLKHFLDPFLMTADLCLQMAQSARGEVICGTSTLADSSNVDMLASMDSLRSIAKEVIGIIPRFENLKAMRQWVAYSEVSPDGMPVVGPTEVEGFVQANCFGSHFLETSTALVQDLADLLMDGRGSNRLTQLRPDRFTQIQ